MTRIDPSNRTDRVRDHGMTIKLRRVRNKGTTLRMIPGEPPRGQSPHPALINCVRLRLKNLYPALRGSSTITSNNSMMRERVIIAGNRLAGNVLIYSSRRIIVGKLLILLSPSTNEKKKKKKYREVI